METSSCLTSLGIITWLSGTNRQQIIYTHNIFLSQTVVCVELLHVYSLDFQRLPTHLSDLSANLDIMCELERDRDIKHLRVIMEYVIASGSTGTCDITELSLSSNHPAWQHTMWPQPLTTVIRWIAAQNRWTFYCCSRDFPFLSSVFYCVVRAYVTQSSIVVQASASVIIVSSS